MPVPPPFLDALRPRPTGGILVALHPDDPDRQARALERAMGRAPGPAGARAPRAVGCEALGAVDARLCEEALLLAGYDVAVIPPRAVSRDLAAVLGAEDAVAEARPEFFLFALGGTAAAPPPDDGLEDSAERTWGVAALGAGLSSLAGAGVSVAVLDTGIDAGHPDLEPRLAQARGFVSGAAPADVHDVQGHGTHCAGTAVGPGARGNRPRYGVAPEAALHVAKVLGDDGAGREGDILAGMAWAIEQGCAVISMSLGRAAQPGESPSLVYERLGRRALERGSLILAAAGNDSARAFGHIAPVGAPANSPSILAVGAVGSDLAPAPFSNGGVDPDTGGAVDLAAPGVEVFSAAPRPRLYRALSGTSMACPHAAGAAALFAGADPALRGARLWDALLGGARALAAPARDVGVGLVRAPGAARTA